MGFLALMNAYTMRICLSITITEMTIPINHNFTDSSCPNDNKQQGNNISITDRYNWDEPTQVNKTVLLIFN